MSSNTMIPEARLQALIDQALKDPGLPPACPTRSQWMVPPCKALQNIRSSVLPHCRDVVILGSGITGCSAAYHLLKDGSSELSVSVLEAREVCGGATGRNGGRIHCTAVQDYDMYLQAFGHEAATQIVRFELAHLDELRVFARGVGGDSLEGPEFRDITVVSVSFSDYVFSELKRMLVGFEKAFPDLKGQYQLISKQAFQERYNIPNAKGALVYNVGAIWGYRLITAAFEKMLERHHSRFSIESHTPALSIKHHKASDYPYTIQTPRGVIRARHVLHCTEAHTAYLVPNLRGILIPRRGQMTVQKIANDSAFADGKVCFSFLFNDGFDYATQNPRSREIWIGGGDVKALVSAADYLGIASDTEEMVRAKTHLRGVLGSAFSDVPGHNDAGDSESPRLTASWTGIMCFSIDKAPLVGCLPEETDLDGGSETGGPKSSGQYISAGYGGYGMVNAFLCGKALTHIVLRGSPPSWLPHPYRLTPERRRRLAQKVLQMRRRPYEGLVALL